MNIIVMFLVLRLFIILKSWLDFLCVRVVVGLLRMSILVFIDRVCVIFMSCWWVVFSELMRWFGEMFKLICFSVVWV